MSHQSLGFGAFRLGDLLPGEEFFASDGTLGKVCPEQRCAPDYVEVFLHPGTSNAERVLRHRTALVFATSPEQARRIVCRVAKRERRARKKGGKP